jgi:mRNA-degrading endonuclease RelE of RelBE toxin-antitoxin system
VRIRWSEIAVTSAARFIADQDGMRVINAAVVALADDPDPPEAFIRGAYRRLRVDDYRVLYRLDGDLITVVRVDRVTRN